MIALETEGGSPNESLHSIPPESELPTGRQALADHSKGTPATATCSGLDGPEQRIEAPLSFEESPLRIRGTLSKLAQRVIAQRIWTEDVAFPVAGVMANAGERFANYAGGAPEGKPQPKIGVWPLSIASSNPPTFRTSCVVAITTVGVRTDAGS